MLVTLRQQLCRLALDGTGDSPAALGIRGTRLEGLEHVAQRGDELFRPQAMLGEIGVTPGNASQRTLAIYPGLTFIENGGF